MVKKINDLLEFNKIIRQYSNIYLAAAGTYGAIVGHYLNLNHIEWNGYLDNNKEKYSEIINGKKVKPYNTVNELSNCVVVICTILTSFEIEKQLLSLGFNAQNIIKFDNRNLFCQMQYSVYNPQNELMKLKELKGYGKKYKRCFVIGTGPSLTISDLELIKDEFTISTNGIYKSFDKTSWRPSAFFIHDPKTKERIENELGIERLASEIGLVLASVKSGMLLYKEKVDNMYYYYSEDLGVAQFSTEVSEKVYESSTSLFPILQIAYYMGFEEIYLLGVDLGFANERLKDGRVIKNSDVIATADFLKSNNSFVPIYETDRIVEGYMVAKEFMQNHSCKIKNATRGGYLEVFERVCLDDIIKRNNIQNM